MYFKKLTTTFLVALLAALAGVLSPAQVQALNIAESPLFVTTAIKPNVQFVIDDSGSMRWGFMPDELVFDYDQGDRRECTKIDYAGVKDTCGSTIGDDLYLASSYLNPSYFDPGKIYEPPVKADGKPYPPATFDAAKVNGYNEASCGPENPCIDLSNNYRAIMDDYYHGFGEWNWDNEEKEWLQEMYGFTVSPSGKGEAAFYYEYDAKLPGCGTDERDKDCYKRRVVTDAEEKQKFANWFSYYRTRLMLAKAGIGSAFVQQGSGMRVGYGAINSDPVVERGVRDFSGEGRKEFFDWLYGKTASGGTPLRAALKSAGEYYKKNEPWQKDPASIDANAELLSCRQSYTILMSDGYWNGEGPSGIPDEDKDGHSPTLADVAMNYYKNDLRGDLEDNVPTTEKDPEDHQHMVTFGVGLGVTGTLDPEVAFTKEPGDSEYWTDPGDTEWNADWEVWEVKGRDKQAYAIDDLLHAAVNSHGGFFSAMDPEAFANELANVLREVIARSNSTTGVAVSATRLSTSTFVYTAQFDSENWTGDVTALGAEDGKIKFRASEQLPGTRKIFTLNPTNNKALPFDSGAASLIDLTGAPTGKAWTAENVVNYVGGNTALEGTSFRERDGLIGDIVNSRLIFSSSGNEGWARVDSGGYLDYIDGKKNDPRDCESGDSDCSSYARHDTIFVGANDGMLHAFDARTMKEWFAYVPAAVHDRLWHLADPDYSHKYYVDGQITVADAKLGSSWGTYLVGGLGAGGRGMYALDVTDPDSFSKDDVMWERTSDDDSRIGFTFGEPLITRLDDGTESGQWVAIFGNGYNSGDGHAYLFVVDLETGKDVIEPIQLGDEIDNGLSGVVGWRDPATRTHLERVYAGDLKGNLWRVDFDGKTASVPFKKGQTGLPLFSDPDARPITSTPNIAASPAGGLMVYFGTGKLIEKDDAVSPFDLDRFYAIKDKNASVDGLKTLGEVTISLAQTGDDLPPMRVLESGDAGDDGWYIDLVVAGNPGERTLSKPRVMFGSVIFSTYQPLADDCTPGGTQRTYAVDALSGNGSLPFCNNCGAIEVGKGAPFTAPVAIKQRPPTTVDDVTYPGHSDPGDPTDPGDFPDPPSDSSSTDRTGWCSEYGIPPLFEGGSFLSMGTICEGRQVWREVQ